MSRSTPECEEAERVRIDGLVMANTMWLYFKKACRDFMVNSFVTFGDFSEVNCCLMKKAKHVEINKYIQITVKNIKTPSTLHLTVSRLH